MPLTPEELAANFAKSKLYEELTKKSKSQICGACEGLLVVAYRNGEYVLSCGRDKSHTGTKSKWKCKAYLERNEREKEHGNI